MASTVERAPRDGRDFGHLAAGSCQARPGRPAYVVERKVIWYVRLRACPAPTRAEAVLRPCRIVRGSEDHGRHALGPLEHGLERSANRNLDPPAFAFLAV